MENSISKDVLHITIQTFKYVERLPMIKLSMGAQRLFCRQVLRNQNNKRKGTELLRGRRVHFYPCGLAFRH